MGKGEHFSSYLAIGFFFIILYTPSCTIYYWLLLPYINDFYKKNTMLETQVYLIP